MRMRVQASATGPRWRAVPWLLLTAVLASAAGADDGSTEGAAPTHDRTSGADDGGPLTLEQVLDRSASFAPRILEARAKVIERQAKRLGAEGAFDRKFSLDSSAYLEGYYGGRQFASKLAQPLRDMGGELYAGYRLSGGRTPDFPVYEDELVTLSGGELAFGATLALLRDRQFDQRRFALRESELMVEMARLDQLLASVQVQHDAMLAYWSWVAAGQKLAIYRDLLSIAEERVTGLSLRLNEGDVAQIDIVENAQRILFRRSLVFQAQRDLNNAALKLSLYYRGADGEPIVPDDARLPPTLPSPEEPPPEMMADLPAALARQADLLLIDRRLELAANLRRLGENDLLPQVDFGVKLARDFGAGSPTRDETDLVVGFEVAVPLERRKARGDIGAAEAQIRQLELRRQRLREQITAQIAQLANIIDASLEIALYATLEVDQAERLEEAEWVRFEEGSSNFFLLNLREERTADARLREVDALADYYRAVADYLAITADTVALRVVP